MKKRVWFSFFISLVYCFIWPKSMESAISAASHLVSMFSLAIFGPVSFLLGVCGVPYLRFFWMVPVLQALLGCLQDGRYVKMTVPCFDRQESILSLLLREVV